MTRAAKGLTGLILILVFMADIAMTIAAKDPTFAGGAQWLLSKADYAIDSPRGRHASSRARPVRWRTAGALTNAQTPAVGKPTQVSPSPTAEVASITRVPAPPRNEAQAPRELPREKVPGEHALPREPATEAIQAVPSAPPVQPSEPASIALAPAPLERPTSAVTIRLDASAGLDLPAPAHLEAVLRGDEALAVNARLSNLGQALDLPLAQHWKKAFDFIEPRSISASFDAQTNEEHLVLDGVATLAWKTADDGLGRRYEADGYDLGWKADVELPPGAAAAPGAGPVPTFEQITETIVLPNRGLGFTVDGAEVDLQAAGRAFRRSAAIADGLFTMTASMRSPVPDPAAAQAADPSKALGATLYLRAPANYEMTEQEVDAVLASSPASLGEYLARGGLLMRRGRSKEAVADFQTATLLDPTSSCARAGLAVAEAWSGDEAAAASDLEKAVALNPREPLVYDGRAILAQKRGKAAEAVAAYGQALELNPGDDFAREQRSVLEASLKRAHAALNDRPEVLTANPDH